ncbi:MAG: hypothetical protein Q4C49_09650 [Bacillota bacterium]|nr:hypothetical protein [Bacillota bacterium]
MIVTIILVTFSQIIPIKAKETGSYIKIGENKYEVVSPSGEISYITEKNIDTDNPIYEITKHSGERYVVVRNENSVCILKNNEMIEEVSLGKEMSLKNQEKEEIRASIPWEGSWGTIASGYSSRAVTIGDYSVILGVCAAIAKVSTTTSIIITVATWIAGRLIPNVYFYSETQTRIWHGWVESRNITKYYTNSSYNQLVPGSSTVSSSSVKLHTVS